MAMRGLAHWRGGMRKLGGHWGSSDGRGGSSNEVWIVERGDIGMGEVGGAWGKLNGREEPEADVKKLARARGGPGPVRLLLGGSGARPAKAGGLLGPSG